MQRMASRRPTISPARHSASPVRLDALHHLRAISPLGARASVIARNRRKAREAFEQDRARGAALPGPK